MLPKPRPVADGRIGLTTAGEESDVDISFPRGRSGEPSSPIKSILAALPDPVAEEGPGSACGSGDGGAGHRPGRAAARSIRLSVCKCDAALLRRELGFVPCCVWYSWNIMGCNEGGDLDIGRGGDGVRRIGESELMSKPEGFPGVR